MYFELSTAGELALFSGAGPSDTAAAKLWGSGTGAKVARATKGAVAPPAVPRAMLQEGKLVVMRGGDIVWRYPVNRLPRVMQGIWPILV
jgi:hypothetical protein